MNTEFEERLKTQTDEELANAYAIASLVDFWKANLIAQEQDRRKKIAGKS
jgi:hypothetical protein